MSSKGKAKREAYQKKQEEKGKKVINWICGLLLAAAVAYAAWSIYMVS